MRLAPLTALFLCAAALPAAAEWIGVGRWGTEGNFRYVAPGTWMSVTSDSSVEITAEGDNHQGRIELWCSAETPAGRMRFSRYRGDALGQPPAGEAGSQTVRFLIDGQSFDQLFEYRPADRDWVATGVLSSAWLDAFAGGSRLELVNAEGERVTAYALNGSGAARQAVRRGCGI